MEKGKKLAQVFTPDYMVDIMLCSAGYEGDSILFRHIMDNSCGNGRILCAAVRKYIFRAQKEGMSSELIAKNLSTFIHGIEIDEDTCAECRENLRITAMELGILDVKWDIVCANTLHVADKYKNSMDYLVCNPPYIRIHNVQSRECVREYRWSKNGNTDLYITFMEIGLDMLKKGGSMCFIIPASWMYTVSGKAMREDIIQEGYLHSFMDMGGERIFTADTDTCVLRLTKGNPNKNVAVYKFNANTEKAVFRSLIPIESFIINTRFYPICDRADEEFLHSILNAKDNPKIKVLNAVATTADDVFLNPPLDDKLTLSCIKCSSMKHARILFPYDSDGKPKSLEQMDTATREYLLKNRERLEKRTLDKSVSWWLYGRSQGMSGVYRSVCAVSHYISPCGEVKIEDCPTGCVPYSGLFVMGVDKDKLTQVLTQASFLRYAKLLGNRKMGGYLVISSRELKTFLSRMIPE